MNPIRIYVAEHQELYRLGIKALLAAQHDFACVGEAGDAHTALREAPATLPDMALLPIDLPGFHGRPTADALRQQLPQLRLVMLIDEANDSVRRRALADGADAVVHRGVTAAELLTLLHTVRHGQRAGTHEVAATADAAALGGDLTQRERNLLALMARGLPNREIGERLAISMPTVKFHVTNILSKLNAENRTSAVLAALRLKLVNLEQVN